MISKSLEHWLESLGIIHQAAVFHNPDKSPPPHRSGAS